MTQARRITSPVHVGGPAGPWREVRQALEERGNAVVFTTWGEWLTAVVTEPRLRLMLGRDWERYRRTTDPLVRYRFAAARLALKYTAAAALDTEAAELDLAYKIGGRPHLRGLRQIDVSLTHTGELIAVGISRTGRIGVDTEPLSRILSFDVMCARACTPGEQAALKGIDGSHQTAAMLRLWTLKEAYTKALGQGLRLQFTEFGFPTDVEGEIPTGHDRGLLAPDGTPAADGAWAFGTYQALDRYLISVACHNASPGPAPGTADRDMCDEKAMSLVSQLLSEEPRPP
ncbi:4'-phosphopantetheinyl transferase superfamily protein [Streptomyces sp. ISL-96]|uniref:4'-phosphopantetheinyl transferase family protein n=1 Tax=Streptomyces sp. ISL-96 TaxID=2819191 RepID=UPI001BE9A18E|nr:4'-phosphopantetheinyl transferase superfamily protein [Streptomyces sp. ISL-96]MBT2493449.1 4'-phosphopantetheinyl transferase superfamily protein [Streptomyces sp. ISL-96]